MRPRGLLLDFGSVVTISVFERHRATETVLGLPPGSLTWLGPLDPSTDPLWQSMQRDEITEREYWAVRGREMGEAVGESGWDMRAMLARIRQADPRTVIRPEMMRLIRAARRHGIGVSVLSNELELFYGSDFIEQISETLRFDSVIDASRNGILKPDPRSYDLAIEAMQLAPQSILFVDDQFRNIAGAVKAGMQTQYFDLRDVAGQIAAVAARLLAV